MANRTCLLGTAFAVFLVASASSSSLERDSPPPARLLKKRLQSVLDAQQRRWNATFSVGVTVGGVTVTATAGASRYAPYAEANATTRIPFGSATKLYTAVAALQAAERGELDLDAPVGPILAPMLKRETGRTLRQLWGNNATAVASMTMRQLLSMRSGIPDYDDDKMEAFTLNTSNIFKDITPPEYVTVWTPKSLLFPPGTGGAYSSNGFVLAGYVLAALAKAKSWDAYDQRAAILRHQPALAAGTPGFQFAGLGPCFAITNTSGLFFTYGDATSKNPFWTTTEVLDVSYQSCLSGWTCGNLVATPGDTSKLLYNVFSPHAAHPLLTRASVKAMLKTSPLTTGWSEGLAYGLGVMATQLYATSGVDPKYTAFVGHGGAEYASSADVHYYNKALDAAIVLGTTTNFGMNCALPDTSDNAWFQEETDCLVVAAVVDVLTNGEQKLECPNYRAGASSSSSSSSLRAAAQRGPPRTRPRTLATSTGGGTMASAAAPRDILGLGDAPSLLQKCALPGPADGVGTCTGASAALNASDCYAWKSLFALSSGATWTRCADRFSDPCGCPGVECKREIHVLRRPAVQTRITGLNMSGSNLRGDVGGALTYGVARLSALSRLDVSDNLLFGRLPATVDLSHLSGCSVANNPLDCPLPPGAEACHRPDQPPPACSDPNKPGNLSAACATAGARLNSDPAVSFFQSYAENLTASVLVPTAAEECGGELQVNRSCHVDLGEWTSTPELAQFVAAFRGNVTRVDKEARLCFLNLDVIERVDAVDGKAEVSVRGYAPVAVPGDCRNEADSNAYLDWLCNAQHQVQAGYFRCTLSWLEPECYFNGTKWGDVAAGGTWRIGE